MAEPWDQLPGEDNTAYARFLMYRNLGPTRSLRKAYQHYLRVYDGFTGGTKRLNIPGNWHANCADHFWVSRAAAWDIRNLSTYGNRLACLHVATITRMAQKNARFAARLNPGDDGWTDLVASVRVVADFLTPDVVRGIQDRNQPARAAVLARPDDRAAVE